MSAPNPSGIAARFIVAIITMTAGAVAFVLWARVLLPPGAAPGILIGLALAAAGAVSWVAGVAWSARRGMHALMGVVVLGILGRLVIYSATLVYVALGTGISLAWTGGALAGSSIVFIVLEVLYALRALGAGPGTVRHEP